MPPLTLPHAAGHSNRTTGALGWRPWASLTSQSDPENVGNQTLAARKARALLQPSGNTADAPRPGQLNFTDSPRVKGNSGNRVVCISDWTPFVYCSPSSSEVWSRGMGVKGGMIVRVCV